MTPWVIRLMIANGISALLHEVGPSLILYTAFVPANILVAPWTIVTYMFVHGGIMHLLFNMLSLMFFGPALEVELGSRHFLGLYGVSGIFGALVSFIDPYTPIVGASGALFGIFLAFARFWPRAPILVFGIVPVEARVMVIGMTVLSLFGGFTGAGNIAHFAHLGGFVGGYIYLKLIQQSARVHQQRVNEPSPTGADMERWRRIDRTSLHEVNREEFDRIMQKLQTNGVQSLSPEERHFLDRFSQGS